MAVRVLVVDNYDSFVYNLVQYLDQLGVECVVRRNDALSAADIAALGIDGVVLSPGPGRPEDAGICVDLVQSSIADSRPLFGVCLGHQAIGIAVDAVVKRAPEPVHGKVSAISHTGTGLFEALPNPLRATRYHSLVVDEATLPGTVDVTARSNEIVMAMTMRESPVDGVQFHPESVLTQCGHRLLANWLLRCNLDVRNLADRLSAEMAEMQAGVGVGSD